MTVQLRGVTKRFALQKGPDGDKAASTCEVSRQSRKIVTKFSTVTFMSPMVARAQEDSSSVGGQSGTLPAHPVR